MSRKETMPRAAVARQNEYLTAVAGVGALTLGCWGGDPAHGLRRHRAHLPARWRFAGMVLSRGPVLVVAALSADYLLEFPFDYAASSPSRRIAKNLKMR